MPAIAQHVASAPDAAPRLRIWAPGDGKDMAIPDLRIDPVLPTETHRIANPVRRKTRKKREATRQRHLWDLAPLDPEVAAAAASLSEQFSTRKITPEMRIWLRDNLTVRQLYVDWMLSEREAQCKAGTLSAGTLSKDRQTINRWEKYSRPINWPEGKPWPGVNVGAISNRLIENVFGRMRDELADTTVKGTRCHFATMIHAGQRLGLIDPMKIPGVHVGRIEPRIYTDAEAIAAYTALSQMPDMQTAFVLSLAAGPRSVDLFGIRWSDIRFSDVPRLKFTAKKTGFLHVIPLAPVAVRHLDRLPRESEFVFPRISNNLSKDPEKSEPARQRTDRFRTILFNIGICDCEENGLQVGIEKPWQVGRKTAGTWIERVERGMSSVLLGHGSDDDAPEKVTQAHYLPTELEPSPALIKAVNAVRWPEVFTQ